MMQATQRLSGITTTQCACADLGMPRASYYRWMNTGSKATCSRTVKGPHPAALSLAEQQQVLDVLNSPRFVDKSPGEVFSVLLDEGQYLCSERTMYRILSAYDGLSPRHQRSRQAGA